MPRTLSANNQAGIVLGITEPVYLLDLDYATPIRLSSRETITYESNSYTGVDMPTVDITPGVSATIRFFNQGLTHSATMISEGTGFDATLYAVYGQPSFSSGDADIVFSGVLGAIEIDLEMIEVEILPVEPFYSPIHRATDENFKHLPVDGMQIQTRSGTFVIKRNN